MTEIKVEIGDEVVVRGKVIWIDDDGVPRVQFARSQMPIRISTTTFLSVTKPEGARGQRKPRAKKQGDAPLVDHQKPPL